MATTALETAVIAEPRESQLARGQMMHGGIMPENQVSRIE
jgi:hypothetical protein